MKLKIEAKEEQMLEWKTWYSGCLIPQQNLKYLPSYGRQTHTLQDAKFQIVLQNGFKDFTFLPSRGEKKNGSGK